MSMMPIILMFVVLYFVMIRPQMKRGKEHKAMIDALQKGDEVVAAGGIVGKITRLNENYVTLQVADNVEIRVQHPAKCSRARQRFDILRAFSLESGGSRHYARKLMQSSRTSGRVCSTDSASAIRT